MYKIHFPTISQFASLLLLNVVNAVFQLLVIPILLHYATTDKVGLYFVALSYGVLASIFVNFGTSQTSVVECRRAENKEQKIKIGIESLAIRWYPFLLAILLTLLVATVHQNGIYFVAIIPMLLAELVNPQFSLIAEYKINKYSVLNVLIRAIIIGLIFYYKTNSHLIFIALFSSGIGMFVLNSCFFQQAFSIKHLIHFWPSFNRLKKLLKTHMLIVGNGVTVHLQQSIFLFVLPFFANPVFLSAYGLIDKLISSCRMLVNAYSAAVLPKATGEHSLGNNQWRNLKKQQNIILTFACLFVGCILFFFPHFVLDILLLGKSNIDPIFIKEVVQLLQLIAIVPLFIALNVLNVAELILDKKFTAYFIAGIIVLLVASLFIFCLYLGLPRYTLGYYPMIIEGACLAIYFLIIQTKRLHD